MKVNYKDIIRDKKMEAGHLMTDEQLKECHKVIHIAAAASAAAGAIPIPVADAIPITAAQITMIVSLGQIFDQKITESAAKGLISSAAATFVGRNLVKLIPFVGWFVSAATAAGVTEGIGWIVAVDMAKRFRKQWEAEKFADEAANGYADYRFGNDETEHYEAEDFSDE